MPSTLSIFSPAFPSVNFPFLSFLLSFSGFNSLLSQKLLGVFMRATLWPYRLVR
jgi:hypothetical protein